MDQAAIQLESSSDGIRRFYWEVLFLIFLYQDCEHLNNIGFISPGLCVKKGIDEIEGFLIVSFG